MYYYKYLVIPVYANPDPRSFLWDKLASLMNLLWSRLDLKKFTSIPYKFKLQIYSPSSWGVCYSCELKLLFSIHHHSNVSLLVFCYFLISQESKMKVTLGIYCRNNWRKLHSCVLWTTICHSIIVKILQLASRCQNLILNTQTGCCESKP